MMKHWWVEYKEPGSWRAGDRTDRLYPGFQIMLLSLSPRAEHLLGADVELKTVNIIVYYTYMYYSIFQLFTSWYQIMLLSLSRRAKHLLGAVVELKNYFYWGLMTM